MAGEIRFIHGTDRIERLAQRSDVANAIRQIRADMAKADRAYAEHEESSGYTREQFIGRAPSASMTWHRSARIVSTTVLLLGYMVHD